MHSITSKLAKHYSQKFSEHGATPKGVDWSRAEDVMLRYNKMLAVIESLSLDKSEPVSLLDVGCGYGGLYLYATSKGMKLNYTGIDVAENMIEHASIEIPEAKFQHKDLFDLSSESRHDYVVCNGILTQKLETPSLQMDQFAAHLIRQMFSLCNIGIAFNIMTTKVNYYSNNLYYRNPAELLSWCLSEISPHIKLDHAYPLYEYTIYVYRNPVS